MAEYPQPIERLADMFRRLDGIGKKTAMRLALSVVDMKAESVEEFADALLSVKNEIRFCSCCQNISTDEVCEICASDSRDRSVICVVEDFRAAMAVEKVREYKGLYHVLHGVISPLDGIGPEKLKVRELLARLSDGSVKEVIMATDPTVEGEATASYISRFIKPMGIKITRLAYGVPVGGNLEYADEVTLQRALDGRNEI